MKAIVGARPSVYGISGLGDYADATDQAITEAEVNSMFGYLDGSQGVTNTTNGTTNPTSGTNMLTAISALTNSFTNIFKSIQPIPAGCTSVAGPYGQSLQCAGSGNGLNTMSLTGATSGISTSTLLLIGGAVVVFMMMKK